MTSIVVAFTVAAAALLAVLGLTLGRRERPGSRLQGSGVRRLLVADDSPTIRRVVRGALDGSGIDIVDYDRGDEALAALHTQAPDLLLVDTHMPGASGLELCREAKRRAPKRPVVLLIGIFEPRDEPALAASGADRILEKPFDDADLVSMLEDLDVP